MSDEQKQSGKKCLLFTILTIFSLLFSIAALTLSIITYNHIPTNEQGEKKVVISKKYDKGKSLDKALKAKKPVIVFFYTDWCGYCQRFAPTFHKVTKDAKIKQNFAVAYINCEQPQNQEYMQEYGIEGFPTVFLLKENGEKQKLDNAIFYHEDYIDKFLELIDKKDD